MYRVHRHERDLMYQLSDYAYHLPDSLIAQVPAEQRSHSRLLHIHRPTDKLNHLFFDQLPDLLTRGDLLVVNNTRVVQARLFGKKETGGRVEVLIIDYTAGIDHLAREGFFQCDCLIRASISPKKGALLYFEDGVTAEIIRCRQGITEVRFLNGQNFLSFMEKRGQLPLPPYISRSEEDIRLFDDPVNYQTVYASQKGAVAAPTAGLHFTEPLIQALAQKKIDIAELTLHVGYGTFVPVKVDDIRQHQIHSEFYHLPRVAADKINRAKQEGRRIIAVGTTSVRTLEFVADNDGQVKESSGQCDLFIYPGYQFKCVDAIITNFHLPESTLLMLISAFYDRQKILTAYETAVKEKYRFFSYGDAMLIE